VYYASDADVSGDSELQAWHEALVGAGRVGGLARVRSIDRLGDVLTMVIFTASAQHAAVNFPQASIWDYVPNMSGALWAPAPTRSQPRTQDDWLEMLPPLDVAHEQINMLELLGSIYFGVLGEYRTHRFPYGQWFEDPRVNAPLAGFRAELEAAEKMITDRNKNRVVPYEFLLPSKIPASINI
jgi:arachidonate 15-lipoxygenase